jgi:hypothetical protein
MGESIRLEAITAIYLRLMDHRFLPGFADLPPDSERRMRCHRLHELLNCYADIAPARVLNRPTDSGSNQSKPFQAQAIRAAGFDIPETVITNDVAVAREFIERAWAEGGSVIYKSASGVRSIVRRVAREDLPRLERIRWCPTQFQRHVPGTDIRVHVVGSSTFAAKIVSDATDYRYAARDIGVEPEIVACELDAPTRAKCIALAERLNLPLRESTCGARRKGATYASRSTQVRRSAFTSSARACRSRRPLPDTSQRISTEMNAPVPATSWRRAIVRTTVTLVVLALIVAILGFFVVPRVVKAKLEAYATAATGRKATLGKVEFNPFTMRGKLTDFTLSHRASEQSLFHFDALDVEVSPVSLWHRAPVLNAIRLTRPTIAVGRNAEGAYDIQDLVDAWSKPSTDPTPQFSLNNIEIDGGAFSLDDRMRKHKVSLDNLVVGIPFLSSLPHDAEIRVNPRFEGVLEGARFMLKGTTSTPFADRKKRRSTSTSTRSRSRRSCSTCRCRTV